MSDFHYAAVSSSNADKLAQDYSLLPLRFTRFDGDRYFVSNFVGEYLFLTVDQTRDFLKHRLPRNHAVYDALKARHFLLDETSTVAIDLLAAKYRTKQSFLTRFTSLFMFVTTLRCDHSCTYCQVTRRPESAAGCDMSPEVADKAVDFMFRSPSQSLKVEFQGGESLLNFDIVKHIVRTVEERNLAEQRSIAFVMTANLSALTENILDFCKEHNVYFSTSLDGPRDLHNANRPRSGHDSYDEAVRGIRRVREALGSNKISALMTTTKASLLHPREIVDEYVRQDFSSIFLRPLNPYGKAVSGGLVAAYTTSEWLEFYCSALQHIIELNAAGVPFREEFAAILLTKILTPFPTGFVDLQSPAGLGISGIVLNYDGDVYPSDEARMLAEMGDRKFRMGSVLSDSYSDIMLSDALLSPLMESMAEGVPGCVDCAFQPYCGSDPVKHYRTQGDVVGNKPTSDFCQRNMEILRHLVRLLEDEPRASKVLRTWI